MTRHFYHELYQYCMVSVTVSGEKQLLRRQDNLGKIGALYKRFILQIKIFEETFFTHLITFRINAYGTLSLLEAVSKAAIHMV